MREAPVEVFDDALGTLSPDLLSLLGGQVYEVGYYDGSLDDRARDRQIPYRIRYPKNFRGAAPVVVISHGGHGSERGWKVMPHWGTAYARLGFLAISIGHLPSANEIQHRFNCPSDITFVIDALCRVDAAAEGTPYDSRDAFRLPVEFSGVEEGAWLDRPGDEFARKPGANFAAYPDVQRIAVLGFSFGAFAALAVAGAQHAPILGVRDFRDPRVNAVVAVSPPMRGRYGNFDKGPDRNTWKDVEVPVYMVVGELDFSSIRRLPFDRFPPGDKYLTIGKETTHSGVAGYGVPETVRRSIDLNTALFFHTYLRGGANRGMIGTLEPIEGWTLERKPKYA